VFRAGDLAGRAMGQAGRLSYLTCGGPGRSGLLAAQNGGTEMSRDAKLRRKILAGIVRRLDDLADEELEGALTYAIEMRTEGERLRTEGERLRRDVFREQTERRQRLAERDGGHL